MKEVTLVLYFNEEYLEYLREKFEIKNKEDLISVIFECIDTCMKM